jgi:WD40 repeat protein
VVSDPEQGIAIVTFDSAQRLARFAPRGDRHPVVGVSLEGTARIWDAMSPYRRSASPPIAESCGTLGSVQPDSRFVAIGCPGHPTRVWDTAHDELLAELPSVSAPGVEFAPVFPAVSSDGISAAVARGNTVEIYDLPGGQLVRTITHRAAVSAVAFGPGGDLVSGDVSGEVLIMRRDGQNQALAAARGGIDAIAMLANGRVVAADASRRLRILDLASITITDLEVPERIGLLRPSPDVHHLITVPSAAIPSQSGSIAPAQLWDLDTGRLVTQLAGHRGRTVAARWISNDEILTAGGDGTARRWDGRSGQERKIYRDGARFLSDASVGPGGVVVAGDSDGTLHFWDVQSADRLWTVMAHTSRVAGLHFEGADLVTRGFGGDVSRWHLPPATKVIEEAVRRGIVEP